MYNALYLLYGTIVPSLGGGVIHCTHLSVPWLHRT